MYIYTCRCTYTFLLRWDIWRKKLVTLNQNRLVNFINRYATYRNMPLLKSHKSFVYFTDLCLLYTLIYKNVVTYVDVNFENKKQYFLHGKLYNESRWWYTSFLLTTIMDNTQILMKVSPCEWFDVILLNL